ncbi:MAG: hypothetical protein ACI9S8_002078 [Chlamydiales bacterium]|jgi:hypothetical protein
MESRSDNMSRQEIEKQTGYTDNIRQTSNLRCRWEWVEPSIWIDDMLTALETE